MLTKQQLLEAPEEAYMNEEQLAFFHSLLLDLKQNTMTHIEEMKNALGQSLRRIADKSYGYCLESGEPIGIPRLLIRPVSEYCADIKIINEGKEQHYMAD